MRMVAIGATAVALLGISIPFVWQQPHAESDPAATIAADVTPAASHDSTAAAPDAGACMADAKPANLDFTFKDLDGKDVALSSFKGKVRAAQLLGDLVRPVQGGDSRASSNCRKSTATSS